MKDTLPGGSSTSGGSRESHCEWRSDHDLASNTLVLVRRDTGAKQSVPVDAIVGSVTKILDEIQNTLWQKALARLKDQTRSESDLLSMSRVIEEKGGFVQVYWCGSRQCEDAIKEKTGADIRVIPFEQIKSKRKDVSSATIKLFGRLRRENY